MGPDLVADIEGRADIPDVAAKHTQAVVGWVRPRIQIDTHAETGDLRIGDLHSVCVAQVGSSNPAPPAGVALRQDRADDGDARVRWRPSSREAGVPEVNAVVCGKISARSEFWWGGRQQTQQVTH